MATATVHFFIKGGKVIPEIDMPISATIRDLKGRIQVVLGISITRQILYFRGGVLRNDRTIGQVNFGEFATLVLDVQPLIGQPQFNILVKSRANQNFNIRVEETFLVRDLKRKIEWHRGILGKLITLRFLSKEMEDNFPLSAYYVSEGSEVEMRIAIQPR